ncbi:hypothetical protein [Alteromonas sp. a30]|uniref:hypothetical protein n=1 Tax=Alteromonas sp. a30 TaxID=2730917 RepID=UPI0022832524|nr:hypothetical protein [Alteromonas sp. a30]MCY7296740.1 hypothetical protein [Alteromonas sp. a30]
MKFNKVIALATLLVLFISQSFAYASMPCLHMGFGSNMATMENHSMTSNMPMEHKLHAEHTMPDSAGNDASGMEKAGMKMDCCDDCNCPPGACATYALNRLHLADFQVSPMLFSSVYRFSMNESDPILPKRPPIAA